MLLYMYLYNYMYMYLIGCCACALICFTVGEWETFFSIPCMSDMQEIDNKATLTLTFDFDDACGCTACARRICVCVPSYVWYMCECHVCVPVSAYLCVCA